MSRDPKAYLLGSIIFLIKKMFLNLKVRFWDLELSIFRFLVVELGTYDRFD
jgi:hypothetical protein